MPPRIDSSKWAIACSWPASLGLGGQPANTPITIVLDAGESYQVRSASGQDDLTGTTVSGSGPNGECKPFAVFSGTECTNVPTGCFACDHIYEENLPINLWGTTYYTVPFDSTTAYTYRVLANENNTSISIDGAAPIVLNAGAFFESNNDPDAHCITSDKPVSVTQYMQGVGCALVGDPAMLLLNSEEQKINIITFSTVSSAIISTHFLNLVAETPDIGNISLNGQLLDSNIFMPYPACPGHSFAQIRLPGQGSYTINAGGAGVSGYVYGVGQAESYAYSVGSFVPLDIPIQDVSCSNDTIIFDSDTLLTNPVWTRLGSSDTLAVGPILVLTPPIQPGLYVATGTSDTAACGEFLYFQVRSVDQNLFVDALAGADSVCAGTDVALIGAVRSGIFSQTFEFGVDSSQWSAINGGAVSIDCGSVSDNALYFNGAGAREATTIDLDVSAGGVVQFSLKIGDAAAPCENADPGEDVILEFSTDGGGTFNPIATYDQD
ncbi:MAG: hypothetical protein AAGB22_11170, partial [Bacteroidota bacterium]